MNNFFETSKKKKRRRGLFFWALRALFNLTLVLCVTAVALVVGLYVFVVDEHGNRLDERYPDLIQDSYIFDADGHRIGVFEAEQSRETVGFEDLGAYLPEAVGAVGDRRF